MTADSGSSKARVASIAVRQSSGGFNLISLEAYYAMPLDLRQKLILEGAIQFFDEQGTRMGPVEALKSLKDMRKQRKT